MVFVGRVDPDFDVESIRNFFKAFDEQFGKVGHSDHDDLFEPAEFSGGVRKLQFQRFGVDESVFRQQGVYAFFERLNILPAFRIFRNPSGACGCDGMTSAGKLADKPDEFAGKINGG